MSGRDCPTNVYTHLIRSIDIAERRARLALRHRLAVKTEDPVEAARSVVGLHSSDPATVYLSSRARVSDFEIADLEKALYDDKALIRFYGMRRTLWVIDRATVPLVHHSSTRRIGERERRRTVKLLEAGAAIDDGETWLDEMLPRVLDVIQEHGPMLTRDLSRWLPGLDGKLELYSKSGRFQGSTGVASRAILQLAVESRVVRARPAGTWISGQYRWAETSQWMGEGIEELDDLEASARLLRSWLRCFGPATEEDIRWWTGWTARQTRGALDAAEAEEVDLMGSIGYLLPDDLEPVPPAPPWVAFLPSLDPTTMGWKNREWYLAGHGGQLFDRNGNAGPTVWANGRIIGGWAQRRDGEIVYELFEQVDRDTLRSVEAEASTLRSWIGEVVVTPRFRSPHDRRLSS